MKFRGYQVRRIWKLRAVNAFSKREGRPFSEIRKALEDGKLDKLFNEAYRMYPEDPDDGAAFVYSRLQEHYGEGLQKLPPRRSRTIRNSR
jgi:hypothetical protein